MAPRPPIQITGINELRRALKQLGDKSLIEELKQANAVVGRIVVDSGKARASTRQEKKAANTLRVAATQQASVGFGKGFAGSMGSEFGAHRDRPRMGPVRGRYTGYKWFRDWRGNGLQAGYFLWPAIRAETPRILSTYADELTARFGSGTSGTQNLP